ncbi:MAG: DinB family protein [Chloroflexi bacterium]|nr:DinB family protein [Chloroflexota bacterium]MDA1146017.1 DinB family protein [Chloroflexota bacterium]
MTSASEPAVYATLLRGALESIARTIDEMSESDLDTHLIENASSAAQLGRHVVGAVRGYALGVGCGLEVERDRAHEFAAKGVPASELSSALRALADDIDAAMATVDPAVFDETTVPEQSVFGALPTREVSRREALVSSIRHAGEHLGHLQLTRDILDSR